MSFNFTGPGVLRHLCSVVTELDDADAEVVVSTKGGACLYQANRPSLGRGLIESKSAPGLDEEK